ncbi:MAG TPA: DHH family phosphoesterase [Candidatus Binatia bacterium]|nr:DHH family phosphoesterase [Candidatus Binatia bacterium]
MQKRWQTLKECLEGYSEALIVLHDDPDPDAVASAEAMRFLLEERVHLSGRIAYRGVIGRAENRALVDFLTPEMETLDDDEVPQRCAQEAVLVIDTQPGAGNSPLPEDYEVDVVIDHHSEREAGSARYRDVRPWVGASSTIITQYLQAAELKPTMRLATALFYGIKTDTKALSRDTSAADIAAYFYLLEFVDVDALVKIENAQVPAAYFRTLIRAMQTARIYDGVVLSYLGDSDYPDLTAEVADLFLRLEGVNWVVCMGAFEDQLYLSVRARAEDVDAEELAQEIIGESGTAGGRNTLAGGQIPLNGTNAEQLVEDIRSRTLEYLEVPANVEGRTLAA